MEHSINKLKKYRVFADYLEINCEDIIAGLINYRILNQQN